ncbi:uncharacterized protein LOC110396389 [Numida meleagris]|uniref:uncharacterized protein LOC110396389 n=1 Tax=Numida meleagris TaxID=8996 RepID=UPI000B3DE2E1|nr:uncharacterized protein LOC110396389 [Numida meleagris]
MVVDSFLLIPSLLLLVAGVSLLTTAWCRQGHDQHRQQWRWWQRVVALKPDAESQAGRHRSPLCGPHCSQKQASRWQGSLILPHLIQPGKTWPLLLRSLCPSLHTDSATGTTSSAGKPSRLPRQDQCLQVLATRGTPRPHSQRSRLGSGVKDLPPEISSCAKPPVKGMIFQEGIVQTEERKRWWNYKTKRPFWPVLPRALPKVHKKAGAAARPSQGPALSLEKKADSRTETCQPLNSSFSDKRSTEKSDRLAMERLHRQLLVALKRPKTRNDCYESGSGTEKQPPVTSFCTQPPVKGMIMHENSLPTEEGKCWWNRKDKRPSEFCIASPALPRVHREAGTAAGPTGPAARLEKSNAKRLFEYYADYPAVPRVHKKAGAAAGPTPGPASSLDKSKQFPESTWKLEQLQDQHQDQLQAWRKEQN